MHVSIKNNFPLQTSTSAQVDRSTIAASEQSASIEILGMNASAPQATWEMDEPDVRLPRSEQDAEVTLTAPIKPPAVQMALADVFRGSNPMEPCVSTLTNARGHQTSADNLPPAPTLKVATNAVVSLHSLETHQSKNAKVKTYWLIYS